MYDIMDYLRHYKDITIDEVHWNVMDNLLCTILTYTPMEDFVEKGSLFCFSIYANRYRDSKENSMVPQVYEILDMIAECKRYNDLTISEFVNLKESDSQFGAAIFRIKDIAVVAYKGTDYSMIGWLENFRLAYEYPTHTHIRAISYLKNCVDFFRDRKIYVCGHSKGGNLAMIAAMEAPAWILRRTRAVYNFDGPGLRKEEFESLKFKKVSEKLVNIVPGGSIVGVLMNNSDYTVIKSSKIGFREHYPTTWSVFGEFFEEGKLSGVSQKMHESTTKGLENLDYEKTKEALEFIFESFGKEYSEDLKFSAEDIVKFYKRIRTIDPDVKKSVEQIMESMIRVWIDK